MTNTSHRESSEDYEPVKAHVVAENNIMIGPSGENESTDTRRMMMVDVRSRVNFNNYNFTQVQFTEPAEFANEAHRAPDHFYLEIVRDEW